MDLLVDLETVGRERELRALADWLRETPSVRRSARISLAEAEPSPGQMGGALEAIQVITGNGWSAAAFVMSVVGWRQTRPSEPQVKVRRGDVEITLTGNSANELQAAIAALAEPGQQG
ncbi:effector-associated constant component EACC1 [Streptacidiphilus cavernicola]|uniref:Uncharacterized protein n=1 Tax=Streptacidiphilus cavernicola TaxID=3342716 RepID=A0ABV6VXD9_9ACTN